MVQGVLSCFEQLFVVDKRNRDSQLLRAATNGYAKFLSVAELPQPSPVCLYLNKNLHVVILTVGST